MSKNISKRSRKEIQSENLMFAAVNGCVQTTLILFNSEVKYWVKQGLFIDVSHYKVIDAKLELYEYKVSFDYSYLLISDEATRFILGNGKMPSDLSFGQELYLFSEKQKIFVL